MNKLKKLALCGLLSLGFLSTYKLFEKPNLRNLANANVFKIVTEQENSGGTGFYFKSKSGKVYVITNSHVCELAKDQPLFIRHFKQKIALGKILKDEPKYDLCVVDSLQQSHGLKLANHVEFYKEYHLFGNPYLYTNVYSKGEIFDIQYVQIPKRIVGPNDVCAQDEVKIKMNMFFFQVDVCASNNKAYVTNIQGFPGNSGSPLLNEYGEVVAVLFAGDHRTNYSFYIVLESVQEMTKGL